MPLTQKVSFKTVLQKGNRVQVPRVIRWQFKMEPDQVLKITVNAVGFFGGWEIFYAQMNRDGRITLPKLTRELLRSERDERQSLAGAVIEVRLEPAEDVVSNRKSEQLG